MAKEDKPKQLTFEDLATSNMWQLEALYRLMVKKGLITKAEFLDEFKQIKKEYDKENKK
jgi:hypothetical protein